MRPSDIRLVTRDRPVDHRCLFKAMGMTKRSQIGHDGTSRQEMTNDEVSQHVKGGQGQDSGPQVPLLGHGIEIKSLN